MTLPDFFHLGADGVALASVSWLVIFHLGHASKIDVRVDNKLDQVDKKFEEIDKRLLAAEKIHAQLSVLNHRLLSLEETLKKITRVTVVSE